MTDLSLPLAFDPSAIAPVDPNAEDRARLYLWLAEIFSAPPSLDAVAAYRRGEGAAWLAQLAADGDLAPGVAQLSAVFDGGGDDDALTARLGIGFGRLLLGIGGPETVSPYESVHRCGGRLFQAPAAEMQALLATHDLAVAADNCEPADHLGIELALMARLIATAHPDRAALAARLAAWVPHFCSLCIDRDTVGFWAGAARILTAVLDREAAPELSRNQEQSVGQRRDP